MLQDEYFAQGEGDAWFQRNQMHLQQQTGSGDWVMHSINQLAAKKQFQSVVELGCANGWRLALLQQQLQNSQLLFSGIDISSQAIRQGQKAYPDLDLHVAPLTQVPFSNCYDLAIVSFVLHWIDRANLTQCIAEIDRLVAEQGYLIISDFLPNHPQRRQYHHLAKQKVFTYKQDYAKIFTSLGTYQIISRVVFSHDQQHQLLLTPCASDARAACTVLYKSSADFYQSESNAAA
jgi:ubiquinone/menaquinone biosynthesis C-methylase UbiE